MTITTIIRILALLIGVGMGYWFAYFTKIADLTNQIAQLKARSSMLRDLVDYYQNKEKRNGRT